MRWLLHVVLLGIIVFSADADNKPQHNTFQALCYHNVVDVITDPDISNITTDQLIAHFKWLKQNGYSVVSIDDIIQAKAGKKNLPEKAVLLTFDDGYSSFYTRIYPLLKLYNYPAVYGVVGKWLEAPLDKSFLYGNTTKSRNILLTWEQIKEMTDSGLIEIASHSYNAHYGTLANPQGNTRPFYTTLMFNDDTQRYESEHAYVQRVERDIKQSSDTLFKHTGTRPRVMLWPFGAYNYIVQELAQKYGMTITATLDNGTNTPDNLSAIKRILIGNNADFDDFIWGAIRSYQPDPQRALYVTLDEIYSDDANITEQNLGTLIEKIRTFGANHIFVKAFADTDGDGLADMLYFPNNTLPVRADLLGRALWQIKQRTGVTYVHAWLPLSAFEINNRPLSLHRLDDKNQIQNIYYAMAKQSFFQGILLDNSYPNHYRSDTLIDFAAAIKESMKYFARNHQTSLLLQADNPLLNQRDQLAMLLNSFDYTVVDTGAQLSSSKALLQRLDTLNITADALKHIALKFHEKAYAQHTIARYMKHMELYGAMNFGYESRRYLNKKHLASEVIRIFSLKNNPYEK